MVSEILYVRIAPLLVSFSDRSEPLPQTFCPAPGNFTSLTTDIPSLKEMGAGEITGIILGVFAGMLIVATVFFLPYYHTK
jgi:hypothetical protein